MHFSLLYGHWPPYLTFTSILAHNLVRRDQIYPINQYWNLNLQGVESYQPCMTTGNTGIRWNVVYFNELYQWFRSLDFEVYNISHEKPLSWLNEIYILIILNLFRFFNLNLLDFWSRLVLVIWKSSFSSARKHCKLKVKLYQIF